MNQSEAEELLGKLHSWMTATNETLQTLVRRTENQQLDIQKLAKEIVKLKKENLIITN